LFFLSGGNFWGNPFFNPFLKGGDGLNFLRRVLGVHPFLGWFLEEVNWVAFVKGVGLENRFGGREQTGRV